MVLDFIRVAAGIPFWLDGGWGIDVLLGAQTRAHADLDIIVAADDVARLKSALDAAGYIRDDSADGWVLVSSHGLRLDVHTVRFDARGYGSFDLPDGDVWPFPPSAFSGTGTIAQETVRCLSPEAQVQCHAQGYRPTPKDLGDMAALQERFQVVLPLALCRRRDGPGLDAWRPWHPTEAAAVLAHAPVAWCVVGGWAIELFLGRRLRTHGDLEIAVPRASFPELLPHLRDYRIHVVGDGEVHALPPGELPGADTHQNWVLEPVVDLWRMDVMLEPGDAETWVFRRDPRVTAARARIVARRDGVPYLRPQAVLLFKAKAMRSKDEEDFEACLPELDRAARSWLADALTLAHPGHGWIRRLARPRKR